MDTLLVETRPSSAPGPPGWGLAWHVFSDIMFFGCVLNK